VVEQKRGRGPVLEGKPFEGKVPHHHTIVKPQKEKKKKNNQEGKKGGTKITFKKR